MDQFDDRHADRRKRDDLNAASGLPRVMGTEGASATGELCVGSFVEDGGLWRPMPTLAPLTKVVKLDGDYLSIAWDEKERRPVHMEGERGVGQRFDGSKVLFRPEDVDEE